MIFNVEENAQRLDTYLAEKTDMSRSRIKKAILDASVLVDAEQAKPGTSLKKGAVVSVSVDEPEEASSEPEDIPVDIVYQDRDIAVINKKQGMVVHPAPGNYSGTLVNALLFHLKDLSGIGGKIRPGIVHRIDKQTSGLLVVAKNDRAHISLAEQIAKKEAKRFYTAIVHGNIKEDKLTIDKPIGRSRRDRKKMAVDHSGRQATTIIRVLERFGDYTLVEAELKTGRTHQIRVHLASIKRPVAGDKEYGPKKTKLHNGGQLLHAGRLELRHPSSGQNLSFTAPLPEYFDRVLEDLRGNNR